MKVYYTYHKNGISFNYVNKEGVNLENYITHHIDDMTYIRNYASAISINFLGQMLYAKERHEPVVKHLMNEVRSWGSGFHNAAQISQDFKKLNECFPELGFNKYLDCVQRLVKEGKNEEAA